MTIKIVPEKIAYSCGIIAILLVLANTAGYLLKFLPSNPMVNNFTLVNLDFEANIPTYFSSLLLLGSGVLLALIAGYKRKRKEPYFLHWAFLAIIFTCMSLDETASMHELLTPYLRSMFNASGIFYFAWTIPGIVFMLAVLLLYARFVLYLPKKTKLLFVVAGILYVMGVIGMEMVGGLYFTTYGRDNLAYGMLTTVEETLEMFGLILFVYGLLDYICFQKMEIHFKFS